jgi:hypothetical protein
MTYADALTYISEQVIDSGKYMGIKRSMFLNPTDDEIDQWVFGPQEIRNAVKEDVEEQIKRYVDDEYPQLAWELVKEWEEEQRCVRREIAEAI